MKLIANNAKLLSEMLNNITADSSSQDVELIKELKETCTNMKPTLSYLISCYSKTTRDSGNLPTHFDDFEYEHRSNVFF